MSRKTVSDFSPEDPLPRVRTPKKPSFPSNFICPIDDAEDFYDPFSDLSLFLAGKIKSELTKENNPKQWSKKIQDLLLKEILPEFNSKFPKYRLGGTALKKTWEKVRLYLNSIDERKEALTPEGTLNVPFMIRENLKELLFKKEKNHLFPYHQAYQLAVKISECIATLEGTRTDLEEMAGLIWSLQKHLIVPSEEQTSSPYEKHTAIDKFIVRYQLEELSRNPTLSQKELAAHLHKKVATLAGLCRIRRVDDLLPSLWTLFAEKMYPHLSIHKSLHKDKIDSIQQFIRSECQTIGAEDGNDLLHAQ